MKHFRSLGIAIILSLLFSSTPGCKRQQTTGVSSKANAKAFATTVVGIYGLKPDPNLKQYSPPPTITLSPDGAFAMAAFPSQWLDGYATKNENMIAAKGNWRVDDDGDGSWEIFVQVTDVNGNATAKRLQLRPTRIPEVGLISDGSEAHFPQFARTSGSP